MVVTPELDIDAYAESIGREFEVEEDEGFAALEASRNARVGATYDGGESGFSADG